jgi:hypothetical protein
MVAYNTTTLTGKDRRSFSQTVQHVHLKTERVTLPLPPSMGRDAHFEMEIYARFMRHLRQVPNSRLEIKILAAIQFTADMMDVGDALVAKTLADLGLRAPRKAFPAAFLDFADRAVQRRVWTEGVVVPSSVVAMKEHWDLIGENRFAETVRDHYAVSNEGAYASA